MVTHIRGRSTHLIAFCMLALCAAEAIPAQDSPSESTMEERLRADLATTEQAIRDNETGHERVVQIYREAMGYRSSDPKVAATFREAAFRAETARRHYENALRQLNRKKRYLVKYLDRIEKEEFDEKGALCISASGEIRIRSHGQNSSRVIDNDDAPAVEAGDLIEVAEKGQFSVLIPGSTAHVDFGGGTKAKFTTLKATIPAEISLLEGKVRFAVNRFKNRLKNKLEPLAPHRFAITTSHMAAVAVRGTELLVEESEDSGTNVVVISGEVEVNGQNKEQKVLVTAGQSVRVIRGEVVGKPMPVDLLKIRHWWNVGSQI